MQQRIIGITGGIATGKTAVSNYLHTAYDLPILDADIYAREALSVELVAAIASRYGDRVLTSDRALDRAALGRIIFQDAAERQWLESQIHPYVRERLETTAKQYQPSTVAMVVPLLFEAGMENLVTEIWVVTCTAEQQLARLVQRDRLTLQEARQRIASQIPLAQKIALADVVIDNSQTNLELFKQIDIAVFRSERVGGLGALPPRRGEPTSPQT
ncbi:dephospho-CoA kinase [Pseudanabaena sp. PCC 6802]|uniref:dephospho-CoA kinase n=1 Tax=Pseudanabaena sp. PCC 6802 TaxID=118173 RepID=UPI00034BC55D|nr:dephospho-CoA kinase [Pseudanabaena sp. PCC 6802]